ncbi:MAG: methylated-DNA--[protein]-cysteine S-methyltransferase [Dysgonamonadaceae bacterium]|jgi:O-6-methylguanine DNA methyltransferase|nr:methylated-DNA--[protein]-cysteine S-methyltransferase [Dysgonamonadaceae bacterium]
MDTEYYQSPAGVLEITADERALVAVRFCADNRSYVPSGNPVIRQAVAQLSEYFAGKRRTFDLPLYACGTAFQEKVWEALLHVPYGETLSYAELARAVRHPEACRAVGNANGRNAIAIIIPCHRVIASDGTLGGYAYGPDRKKWLLDLEKRYK